MKKLVLKSVALAVGALVSGVSFAQVNLDAASPTPVSYANELTISSATLLEDGAAADQRARAAFGASFGSGVTAYVRIEIVGGTITGTPSFAVNDSAAAAATVSVAQSGTGFIIYAVTPTGANNLVATELATFDTDTGAGAGVTVTSKAGVTLQYRLFETLTAAANPTGANTLKDTGAKSYIAFSNAFSTTVTTQSAVADVGATPSYSRFTGNAATAPLGYVTFALATRAKANGTAAALTDIFAAGNTVTAAGDFTLARNADSTYTGAALNRVFLSDSATFDCTPATAAVPAATLNATTATFARTAAQLTGPYALCVTALTPNEINVASYTLAAAYTPNTGYGVTNLAATSSGTVTRNGVRMVAPLVQTPSGWLSRLVLTNTGTTARAYTVAYVTEAGVTVTATGAGSSGTLAANSTTVVDLANVLTIAGGSPRASLVVTVNAPQSQIDGLYQIVNPTSNTISNHILSYKN